MSFPRSGNPGASDMPEALDPRFREDDGVVSACDTQHAAMEMAAPRPLPLAYDAAPWKASGSTARPRTWSRTMPRPASGAIWPCGSIPRAFWGGEKRLVLHGGGNTSLKTRLPDLIGQETDVLCVKGSGWDMAAIEPAGLPAVRLAPLRTLRARERLERRGHGADPARQPARPDGAQPFGRDAAARLPAAQITSITPMRRRC